MASPLHSGSSNKCVKFLMGNISRWGPQVVRFLKSPSAKEYQAFAFQQTHKERGQVRELEKWRVAGLQSRWAPAAGWAPA